MGELQTKEGNDGVKDPELTQGLTTTFPSKILRHIYG